MKHELSPCPICGAKAFVDHLAIPESGLDFGWESGCPRFKNDDKWHHISADKPMESKPIIHGCVSKAEAVEAWNRKAAKLQESL